MSRTHPFQVAAILIALLVGSDVRAQTDPSEPRTLSAFFGLDDSFPAIAAFAIGCPAAAGLDGMPLVMSRRVDGQTLDPSDFAVHTLSGVVITPICVTFAPAIDPGENRTVLLLGEFGDAGVDPPVSVEITGELLADASECSGNFQGAQAPIIPLAEGPSLVWAEVVPQDQWPADVPATATQVVRATWDGGVTQPSGAEIGDAERELYRVIVEAPDGSTVEVIPFALADLNDNDNNHELCLDVAGTALSVSFPGGIVTDPNGDLNLPSDVAVTSAGGWTDLGFALAGVFGDPVLTGTGSLAPGSDNEVALTNAAPSALAGLFISLASSPTPFAGGTLVPVPWIVPPVVLALPASGDVTLSFPMDFCLPPGVTLYLQWVILDAAAVAGRSISNAIVGTAP